MARAVNAGRRMGRQRRWIPATATIHLRPSADTLADVRPLLARVVAALGTNAAARVLAVDRAQVSRWGS